MTRAVRNQTCPRFYAYKCAYIFLFEKDLNKTYEKETGQT